ncbi:MAG: hypothetical protein ABI365_08820 [Lysobacteraceae bacterium]
MLNIHFACGLILSIGIVALALPMQSFAAAHGVALPPISKPSRAAEQGCKWEKFADASLPLDAWVQRCDFGSRKIDFVAVKHSLAQRWSDSSGAPDPLVDVLDLKLGETPENGIRRLFNEHTDKQLAAHCVLSPLHETGKSKLPAGLKRYIFMPNSVLAKALKAKANPNDVPDPPCGDWGYAPDGIQYWEAQPASGIAKVLFVRVGQETPLFDEATLRLK